MTQIIIAQRGWIFVGKTSRDGDQIVITECLNIRRWGTERGLGQLALDGPQSGTVMDLYGTVRLHVLAICAAIECSERASAEFSLRAVEQ